MFDAADMQAGIGEVDLVPAKVDDLARPEAVSVGDQDHGGVAMSPAVLAGGLEQPFDLGFGQVLAGPVGGIHLPARHCPVFDGWCNNSQSRVHWAFPFLFGETVLILALVQTIVSDVSG